jgi:pimeloyl-ACP methyl ester carboxylesterase
VITIDLRGFGASRGAGSIADFADDVARVLDRAGVVMSAVCGCSMGGYVALAFAARHGARLSALVLSDTRAGADAPEARRQRDAAITQLKGGGIDAYVSPLVDRLLSPRASAAVRLTLKEWARAQSASALSAGLLALRDRPDRSAELSQVACPTLVVVGEDDVVTPPAEARQLAAAIPSAHLVELPGAGHLPCVELPPAFGAAVRAFLADAL